MPQIPDYIGSVVFANDVTVRMDLSMYNAETKKCVGGSLVPITNVKTEEEEAQGYPIEVIFEFETRAIVDALRRLWSVGVSFSFQCDEQTGTAMIDTADDAIEAHHISGRFVPVRRVRGKTLDLWNGVVRLIVIAPGA